MSSTSVTRPIFYEGQILASADLTATVDYARQQMARHECFAHIPGVVSGCALTFDAASGNVTVGSGMVTDGTGREIVVPSPYPLDPSTLSATAENGVWYPVFIVGVDQAAPPSSNLTGACAATQSTRTQEYYQFQIGPAGAELASPPPPPSLTSVPGNGGWQVLIGFVQLNPGSSSSASTFAKAAAINPESGVGPQYVGINAAEVESPSGSLLLSTHPTGYTGANPVMGLQISEENGGQLIFGKVSPNGTVTPGILINAAGILQSAVTPGSVQVQSGIACDGMILPLPIGIAAANVIGSGALHTHISLRMSGLQPPSALPSPPGAGWTGGTNVHWVMLPYECWVNPTTLEVHCRVQWIDPSGFSPPQILSALCDYMVIVATPAAGGGS
jgi:hypothetical protein